MEVSCQLYCVAVGRELAAWHFSEFNHSLNVLKFNKWIISDRLPFLYKLLASL